MNDPYPPTRSIPAEWVLSPDEVGALIAECDALKAENERLRGLLRLLTENVPITYRPGMVGVFCFHCGHPISQHSDDCRFMEARAALDRPAPEE